MRREVRFLLGVLVGLGALGGYLWYVGPAQVVSRATAIAPWAVSTPLIRWTVSTVLACGGVLQVSGVPGFSSDTGRVLAVEWSFRARQADG